MSHAPWEATLSDPQHQLISFFLMFALFALVVGFVRAWMTHQEVGVRYRTATVARTGIKVVAALAYVVLLLNFQSGYDQRAAGWVPNAGAIGAFAPRYVEWSITVPLLVIELLSVTSLAGAALRRVRFLAGTGAFLMIFTGYLGGVVSGGDDRAQLFIWGGISCVFWIAVTSLLIRTVRLSMSSLTHESADILRDATTVLLSGWVIYPVVFVIQIFGSGGTWATVIQIGLCLADVVVKLGFGGLTHRVAKLRTAEDVRAGDDVHPESIWISSIKQSDAGTARNVYIANDSVVHLRRQRPAENSAVASPLEYHQSEFDER